MPVSPIAVGASALPTASATPRRRWQWLDAALLSWLGVAALGQLMFAAYVLVFYGRAAALGQWEHWRDVTPRGHVPGEPFGNMLFGAHLLFTVVVVFGGLIQLVPALRRRAPMLHRWNGRLYLLSALALAIGGIVMLATRGTVGGLWQQLGTATNGVVIAVCAALAWRHARAGRVAVHRRWALRLFLAVNGVWFFRVGLMAWLLMHRAPVGFDPETFSGPFLTFLAFAQFMLPLAVLELVFVAQASVRPGLRIGVGTLVLALALLMAVGIVGASMSMWLPHM